LGGVSTSTPPSASGRASIDRRASLEEQASAQRQPTILRLPSQKRADLFDSEEFDPVKLINQLYPDGAKAQLPIY
jgi:hypothetical protein